MIITRNVSPEKTYIILELEGNFEFEDSQLLENTIISSIDEFSCFSVILNFKKISYLNSFSLNEFVKLYSGMLKKGVRIHISELSESAANIFNMTSLNLIIPVYSNNEEALKKNNLLNK